MLTFKTLFEIADSADELDHFLRDNVNLINLIAESNYEAISKETKEIRKLILLKKDIISNLNFSNTYNRAFIVLLIELCERLGLMAPLGIIYKISQDNNIVVGERLNAVLLYLHGIKENSNYIEKFYLLCDKIQYSIFNEEDSIEKPISTFLNYYSYVINNTKPHIKFAQALNEQIEKSILDESYEFLKHDSILKSLELYKENCDDLLLQIQLIIDNLLGKKPFKNFVSIYDELLIEDSTPYSKELRKKGVSLHNIRSIALTKSKGENSGNRGTKILESESELFSYTYRFWNMHRAKLEGALSLLEVDSFKGDINLIDWGCGQGVASLTFFEEFGVKNIKSCTLIEPSSFAIKRAALHVSLYDEKIIIKTICKELDFVKSLDLPESNGITVHLFSNILDIETYDQNLLTDLISENSKGVNFFICVSPYIDEKKSYKVDCFKRYFMKNFETFQLIGENQNIKSNNSPYWNCNNNYNSNMCVYHKINGCNKKWARITRVFKVIF